MKTHPRFTDYKISRKGRVYSVKFGKILKMKLQKHKQGYRYVKLSMNGKKYHELIHRLVLETFIGPCPQGHEARHFPDRDPTNNNLDNLSWADHQTNMNDRKYHGTNGGVKGQRNTNWRKDITEEDIEHIRAFCKAFGKGSRNKMARLYKLHRNTVTKINQRVLRV